MLSMPTVSKATSFLLISNRNLVEGVVRRKTLVIR